MEVTKFIKATIDYFKYLSEYPNDYTKQRDFINLVQNNNSVLEMLTQELWQPNKTVEVGQVIWSPNMNKNRIAIVTTAGTTNGTEPTWGATTTTDGNVTYDMKEKVAVTKFNPLDIYPIGSIYMSVNSTNPANLFGGTWTQLSNRFLIGASDTYSVNSTGGEATHTLTTAELPSHSHGGTVASGGAHTHTASSNSTGAHTHTIPIWNDDKESKVFAYPARGTNASTISTGSAGSHSHTITVNSGGAHTHTFTGAATGSGQSHNNMPPYLAVYMWKRTA